MNFALRNIPSALAYSAAVLATQSAHAVISADTTYKIELGYVNTAGSTVQTGSGSFNTGQDLGSGFFDVSHLSLDLGPCTAANILGCGIFTPSPPPPNEKVLLQWDFIVAAKKISWSYDDESPKETVTFEYGVLQVGSPPAYDPNPISFSGVAGSQNSGWSLQVSGLGRRAGEDPPWNDCVANPARCGEYFVLNASGNVVSSGLLGVLSSPVTAVPEPSQTWLLLGGLSLAGLARRKRTNSVPTRT